MRVLVCNQNIGYPNSAELSNREPTSMHTVQIFGIMNSKKRVSEASFKNQGKSVEHYQAMKEVLPTYNDTSMDTPYIHVNV